MRILTLTDDDLVINDDILREAEYVVELEEGEMIADFEQVQNLTNEEILDELDDDDEPYMFQNEMFQGQDYSEFSDINSIDTENTVFVRIIDLTENLDESQLKECAFYMKQPDGFAFEIVQRDSE
jgi:uncharacterized Fe-S cluster-containing radical SAM superfamily enzyme